MNYAVMYEYAVDRNSGQFHAPFNQILNEHRVYTYLDTSVIAPNSDTPYSRGFLDLRAEPVVVSVPTVDLKRYYSVMLTDSNTYNYGYMGSRAMGGRGGDFLDFALRFAPAEANETEIRAQLARIGVGAGPEQRTGMAQSEHARPGMGSRSDWCCWRCLTT
jgi:hypothetical protein